MFLKAIVLSAVLVFLSVPSAYPQTRGATYSCPMHPEVTSVRRGRCPKCGMDLTRRTKVETADASTSFSSKKIPDVRLYDQSGKQLNFYTDLVKDKTVAINFIFTTCTAACPPLTATFRKVQQQAVERRLDVHLISISVDPTVDTPERLKAFAEKFKAEPGWKFVTGEQGEIDSLLKGLGAAITNKNDHTPMMMIGNDRVDQWTRAYGLSSPDKIVDLIAEIYNR